MRIQVINPNTSLAMTVSIGKSAEKVSAENTEIIAVSPEQGVPSIEGHYDEAISALGILKLVQQGREQGVDGHVIACFGDPALHAAREVANAPVIGIAEAAFHMATLVSTKFSIVTTLSRTKIIAEHLLHQYGFVHKCAKIRCIDLPVLDLENNEQQTYQKLLENCLAAKQQDEIGAIVLGCGGMAKLAERIATEIDIPVIDGVTAAVKLIEALHGLGIKTSKWGDYNYPEKK
ncbi:aspartate/glutamate racemase family protein [Acinetobacter qingfengensis]|uniref:Hydantoin racemase n=1 Tax=Acinetobacter qingfengensis TaxID=1262585 RepID=A0A1E7REH5_9GAMM|nr:aspartate/glutamate racemase family protein [Acinetobacter qingfengensis]KAA8734777.1 aspartate/glutamate racemase family protein [Acinetobacter qingfengensis]OEY97696.1 Asp/Glu/hydantoin racemase [Acinetobacter qingfengensis]